MAKITRCPSVKPVEWMKGKMVGSGSFGTVHLAMNRSNGALFVVKSAESETGIQCLENEANILENLNSPHVVHCFGRELHTGANGENKLNLFIEYMTGGSLVEVAEKFGGILDEKMIRLFTREILQGLKYLHRNGIVHSDLKCKNVLLGVSGNIKLADFGCAKKLYDLKNYSKSPTTSCQFVGGTPLWMAPEVLRNEGLNVAADIWSLGCTVVEMATGKSPWDGDDVSNPMAAVLKIVSSNEIPRFPTYFSKEGLDFLAKCLERDPRKRWTAEELLSHPFISENLESCSYSPASVLDVGALDDEYESNESPDGREFVSRIPFSVRNYGEKQRFQMHWMDDHLELSKSWVTVRTG